jgi:hypothetical protein
MVKPVSDSDIDVVDKTSAAVGDELDIETRRFGISDGDVLLVVIMNPIATDRQVPDRRQAIFGGRQRVAGCQAASSRTEFCLPPDSRLQTVIRRPRICTD